MGDEHLVRPLEESDLDALIAIRQVAFLDATDYSIPEQRERQKRWLEHRRGCFISGELAASASWLPFDMYVYGKRRPVIGLASVSTAGEFRRRGCVETLMRAGLEEHKSVGWCLEYPFDTRFYRRYGWETIANGTFVEVPIDRMRVGTPIESRRVTVDDEIRLARMAKIHTRAARQYNFSMSRQERFRSIWNQILGDTPWRRYERRFAYLTLHGYCVFDIEVENGTQTLDVVDWAFDEPAGREEVFGVLGGFAGQAERVRLQLPSDDPLCHEWSNFTVPHPHPLHARVVCVVEAFRDVPTTGDFEVVVRVVDEICDWNDGRFTIVSANGVTTAEPTEHGVDLDAKIDIRDLARLLSGTTTYATLKRTGRLVAKSEHAAELEKLRPGACHMSLADYF